MTPQTANQINSPQVGQADIVPNTDEIIRSQQATIARLIEFREAQGKEIVALKSQLTAANAACAEMRERVIEAWNSTVNVNGCFNVDFQKMLDLATSATATDCGRDFIHKEQVKPLVETLERCFAYSRDASEVRFISKQALARAKELGLI